MNSQHAYDRMLSAAFDIGGSRVKVIANDFTSEALEECAGIALFEIDKCDQDQTNPWPHRIVLQIVDEVLAERKSHVDGHT